MSPKLKKSIKNNRHAINKIKWEIDYFDAGPGMEANKVANVETALKMHDNIAVCSQELDASKASFLHADNTRAFEV